MADQILPGIEHVVVVMFENRSFDNVFGGLYPKSSGFDGLTGKEYNVVTGSVQPGTYTVWQAPNTSPGITTIPYPDPGEEFTDMNSQLFGTSSPIQCSSPTMGGFAQNYVNQIPSPDGIPAYAPNIMQYYAAGVLPWSWRLAQQYAVCDAWFAAAPVQTLCNRTFMHTGTASKNPNLANGSRINNEDYTPIWYDPQPTVSEKTVFEQLDDAIPDGKYPPKNGHILNWKVYYEYAPLSALCKYVYEHWDYDHYSSGNVFGYSYSLIYPGTFVEDIQNGTLPTYSFIEPAYLSSDILWTTANSNHPGGSYMGDGPNAPNNPPPVDMKYGEARLADIYNRIYTSNTYKDNTLLIVIYDEHGGLYDHVAPGQAVSPFSPPVDNFNYDRYGVRVPAILIGPGIKPGSVFRAPANRPQYPGSCKSPFQAQLDHTSVIATIIQQFAGDKGVQPLTPRVAAAPTLAGLVQSSGTVKHEVAWDVLVAGAAAREAESNVPKKLGASLRTRNYFLRLKTQNQGPQGNSINNALIPLFGLVFSTELNRAVHSVRAIFDLDRKSEEALHKIGVRDTSQLRAALEADGGIERIAKHVGVDPALALRWLQQANLLRVPGISSDDAYLLVSAEINRISELAKANADELQQDLEQLVTRFGIDEKIPQKEIESWIAAAQQMVDSD